MKLPDSMDGSSGRPESDAEAGGFTAGTVISGRYRIVALLGRGGMGEVYRADDLKLDQQVALKLLPVSFENNGKALELLFNEVKTARRISHPNICRVHDIGEAGSRHFLTMEYIDGENLASLLRRIGQPSSSKALELGQQICAGLAAAHRQGILHRDLKPANLMIDGAGRARLTDFGLAGLADRISGPEISFGTPAYMAPEQKAGREVSVASDVYALGLVLYELFTGQKAFIAEERGPSRAAASPQSLSTLSEDLDPAVERVILQCLEEDPRNRPPSVEHVAASLAGVEPQGGAAALKTLLACRAVIAGDAPLEDRDPIWRSRARELAGAARELAAQQEKPGDLFLTFDRPISAVRYAVEFHRSMGDLARQTGVEWESRVGIHLGEVVAGEPPIAVYPALTIPAQEILTRLVALAANGQTLLSRGVFDLARQSSGAQGEDLRWLAHGSYECAGLGEPLEVCEVGTVDLAPLVPPSDSREARRRLVQQTIAGWRPAPGLELPRRPHWTLVEKISEGGFGEVWLVAHEKTHERRVFKFCYDPEKLRALQREITLFRLLKETLGDRDDITRILDWSLDEPPYFIESEYTEGGSVVDWSADRGGLAAIPLETRVVIAAQVARALAAAHSVGVLHKDVKPANVLVNRDAEGQVRARLSDFGVGLVTEDNLLQAAGITVMGMTEAPTLTGSSFTGTRLYMAPEVMEGNPATLQADIYALGVMLFQLVVGDFARALAPGWERQVDDPLLREDIAAAVDGALERRLSSAAVLAERLESLAERRAALLARRREEERVEQALAALSRSRRRWRISIAAMALLLVFAGAMAFMWQRVSREAEVALQVSDFLVELFEIAAPEESLGNTVTARELLDRGAAKIEGDLTEHPEVRGRLMRTMGEAYRGLGLYDASAPLLEKSLELHRDIYGDEDLRTVAVLDEVADIERLKGNYDVAVEIAREALRVRKERLGEEHLDVTESLVLLAQLARHNGNFDHSSSLLQRALEIRQTHLGEGHFKVAEILTGLGHVEIAKGDYSSAETLFADALAIKKNNLDEQDPGMANCMTDLGFALYQNGSFDKAEPLLREALEIQRRILGEGHPALIGHILSLALLYQAQGAFAEAEDLFKESAEITLSRRGKSHPFYGGALRSLAGLYKTKGDYELAKSHSIDAVEIFENSLGFDHPTTVSAYATLGEIYHLMDEDERAEEQYRKALSALGDESSENEARAWILHNLALSLEAMGDVERADEALDESLNIARRLFGAGDFRTAVIMITYAGRLVEKGLCEEAEVMASGAIDVLSNHPGEGASWRKSEAEGALGACLAEAGQFGEAEVLLLRSYQELKSKKGVPARFRRRAMRRLAVLYEAWGKKGEAERYLDLTSERGPEKG